jgi:hypothetical protein
MCTVTIVAIPGEDPGAFRFACNRDELRTRRPARPPVERRFGPRTGLHPVDADAGGTWIGANDAGLVLSLLNLNPPAPPALAGPLASRGAIIPSLLHHDSVEAALADAVRIDPAGQKPFRLVLADRRERALVRGDGCRVEILERTDHAGPFMVTSSGLGDHLVESPRRQLFDRMLADPAIDPESLPAAQDAFHRSHWPDRGHLSVSMVRPDAWTLSHTLVTVTPAGVSMAYRAGVPHEPAVAETTGVIETARPSRRSAAARTAG